MRTGRVEGYRSKKTREHHIRVRASNGKILAALSEGYKRERDAKRALLSTYRILKEHFEACRER